MAAPAVTVAAQLKKVPSAVRPTVNAARRTLKSAAPNAKEVAYRSKPPRSKSAMWKLARYAVGDEYVAGIGTFTTYAAVFSIADGSSTTGLACSRAPARTRGSFVWAHPPTQSGQP